MKRRQVIGTLAAGAAVPAAGAVRDQFLGVWKLVKCVRTRPDGQIEYPYGEAPTGRITYDRAGRMSAQLMRPGRTSSVASGESLSSTKVSEAEIRETVRGFTSYFGTFDVDEASATVIHHVQAALVPSWVGTDLRRSYRFSGNRLELTAKTPMLTVLTWERLPD